MHVCSAICLLDVVISCKAMFVRGACALHQRNKRLEAEMFFASSCQDWFLAGSIYTAAPSRCLLMNFH